MVAKQKKPAQISLSAMRSTLEATADGILVVNRDGKMITYNQKFRKMWNIPDEIMTSKDDQKAIQWVLQQLSDPDSFVQKLMELYANPESDVFDEIEFKDGRIFERFSIPQISGKEIVGRVFSFRDVTERKRMEAQLMHQATHDSLTGLPNRALLLDRIKQDIKRARRNKSQVAVIFLDLDRFKDVNDSLGHDMGDVLLKKVSKRLERGIREYDTLARWGGDEFVMIIPDLKEEEDVIPIIRNIMQSLASTFQVQSKKIKVTNSIGISFFPKDGELPNNLLKNADSAMYHAKSEGRNNFQFYQRHMSEYVTEKLDLENDLMLGIERKQFFLVYQPIIDMKTGDIKSVEALLRWNHPERGLLAPDKFIPLAEETGAIQALGEWVLRQGCTQLMSWVNAGLPRISMAINVSVHQLKHPNFIFTLESVLRDTKVDPTILELEMTESSLMSDAPVFMDLLKKIKAKGISFNIDDFGTGYSSLNYLKVFQVDKLKIDKAFVQDEPYNQGSIILSIIALAKKLKLKVVAEGVETNSQYCFLQNHHCDYAQGYFFSRPVEPDIFAHLLKQNLTDKVKKKTLAS
jgi:diguanylate cyclase (GGDEF)-like protein/PAS domain S-box-containing protein